MPDPRLMWERPNDPAFVQRLAAGTVGFRLTPSRVVAKRKLSQNKDGATVERVIAELSADGVYANPALAAEMRRAQDARPGRNA
jgi:transcriptional regulator